MGVESEGVNLRCEFDFEDAVHRPVPVHPVPPLERIGHHHHLEVAFRTGRHAVHMAFVDHREVGRREFGRDLLLYRVLDGRHRHSSFPPAGRITAPTRPG